MLSSVGPSLILVVRHCVRIRLKYDRSNLSRSLSTYVVALFWFSPYRSYKLNRSPSLFSSSSYPPRASGPQPSRRSSTPPLCPWSAADQEGLHPDFVPRVHIRSGDHHAAQVPQVRRRPGDPRRRPCSRVRRRQPVDPPRQDLAMDTAIESMPEPIVAGRSH
jgi:hypothetical protein